MLKHNIKQQAILDHKTISGDIIDQSTLELEDEAKKSLPKRSSLRMSIYRERKRAKTAPVNGKTC
jgi:hypothetical protein